MRNMTRPCIFLALKNSHPRECVSVFENKQKQQKVGENYIRAAELCWGYSFGKRQIYTAGGVKTTANFA
jgi:hypothetical protein